MKLSCFAKFNDMRRILESKEDIRKFTDWIIRRLVQVEDLSKEEVVVEIDEEYEKAIVVAQKSMFKKESATLVLSIIPVLITTLISFWTFSIANVFQIILLLIVKFCKTRKFFYICFSLFSK